MEGKLQLLIWSVVLVLVLVDLTEEDLVTRLPWSSSIILSGQNYIWTDYRKKDWNLANKFYQLRLDKNKDKETEI